jgi:DNA repair photolyase
MKSASRETNRDTSSSFETEAFVKIPVPKKSRGALTNITGRFEKLDYESVDDGWEQDEEPQKIATVVSAETAKSIISRNKSPDVSFNASINPYRGCEHGCIYCFARPTHAYLELSPGLDFETQLFYKKNAADLLRQEFNKQSYQCEPISLGINTDAYQPMEKKLKLTRQLLQVLQEYRHPVAIVTKSNLVERDIDILAEMAQDNLAKVMFSITALDNKIKSTLEPRTASYQTKLSAMKKLNDAGVPVGVMVAPVIPFISDHHLESVLEASQQAGATSAGYVILRLPHEVRPLFKEWLQEHYPDRAKRVLNWLKAMHGGKEYRAEFGKRMTGSGHFASLLSQRFKLACQRLGLNLNRKKLDCSKFRRADNKQLSLFS